MVPSRPHTPRQGISFRNLNRRLLPAGRMLVSVEDSASLHPPQAALRLRPPWTPARDGTSDINAACFREFGLYRQASSWA